MYKKAFTLIELLVVIGILAILLGITLVAINPARQFALANNTKRQNDVKAILDAVSQYQVENKGASPTAITTTAALIGSGVGQVNICALLTPIYIAALPVDPLTNNGTAVTNCAAGYNTNYRIVKSASDSRITVSAPAAELSATISVTR